MAFMPVKLTMRPQPFSSMPGKQARDSHTEASRSTEMTRRHSASLISRNGLLGRSAALLSSTSTVTGELERSHQVVAPDLPGIGVPGALLPSFGAYAAWLEALLDSLAVERATIVGNSLGATIAWRFASQYPERCRGLVMVNGYPPPAYNRGG